MKEPFKLRTGDVISGRSGCAKGEDQPQGCRATRMAGWLGGSHLVECVSVSRWMV